jgi:hypothetical protein
MWSETFGNFAPATGDMGGWRPFTELEKPLDEVFSAQEHTPHTK